MKSYLHISCVGTTSLPIRSVMSYRGKLILARPARNYLWPQSFNICALLLNHSMAVCNYYAKLRIFMPTSLIVYCLYREWIAHESTKNEAVAWGFRTFLLIQGRWWRGMNVSASLHLASSWPRFGLSRGLAGTAGLSLYSFRYLCMRIVIRYTCSQRKLYT